MFDRTIALLSPHWRFRSAVTGKFVTKLFALTHPRETVRERVLQDSGDVR